MALEKARIDVRKAYFAGSWYDTDIYDRALLPSGATFSGPAIVEQFDSTFVIDPGAAARVDEFGNIIVDVTPAV
jgi:N-methylhydantoinase A